KSAFARIHVEPEMVEIKAGAFHMGDVVGRGDKDEQAVHEVGFKNCSKLGSMKERLMNFIELFLPQIGGGRMIGGLVEAASPLSMFRGRMLWLMRNGYRNKHGNVTACPPRPSGSMPHEPGQSQIIGGATS